MSTHEGITSLAMSPFLTTYSLLRNSTGLMERASSLVNPISVFWKRGTWGETDIVYTTDICTLLHRACTYLVNDLVETERDVSLQ